MVLINKKTIRCSNKKRRLECNAQCKKNLSISFKIGAHRSQILDGIRNTRTRPSQHQALHVLVFCFVVLPSFYINIKYTIRMMPKDIMFFMSRIVPLSFSSRLAVVLPCSLTITICEECDDHFFFIQKRVHIIAWTWCHFLHVRSMAWTGRMFQMKMQNFCAQAQKKQASKKPFLASVSSSVLERRASYTKKQACRTKVKLSGTNVKIKVNMQIFCARAQKSKHA